MENYTLGLMNLYEVLVFSIELELKFSPLIVIVLPISPNADSIKSMVGWAIISDTKEKYSIIRLII